MKLIILINFILITSLTFSQTPCGRVQIQNGTLVTDKGTLLRGCYVELDNPIPSREDVAAIKDLGLNSIHVYAESYWQNKVPGYHAAIMDSLVKWTKENSLYLIMCNAGFSSDTPESEVFMTGFWNFYAPRYKDETHVIYEICNEPSDEGFDSITIAMELTAYDTIRKYAPETHILLMSPPTFYHYSEFLNDIENLGDGIDWSNASIAVHAYNWPAQDYIEPIRKIKNAGYALTITEFASLENKYANLALTRVFEQEYVSYFHFLSSKIIIDNPAVFKSRVESSEVRWMPDFGTWPESITEINYEKPYKYWPVIFYDEGAGFLTDFTKMEIGYITNNSYIAYYNIDFEEGAETFTAYCASPVGAGTIKLHLDSLNGPIVGTCIVGNTGDWAVYQPFSCEITQPFGGVHKLYLVFKEGFNIKNWFFIKSVLKPQTPYNSAVSVLPGKIEAEEYDLGGLNVSYFDNTPRNDGNTFRNDDVDIDKIGNDGYCIGWTEPGEWLEYTVSCEKDTAMDIQLRVACTAPGDKIKFKLNNQSLATVYLPNTGEFYNYQTVTVKNITIAKGENQIVRLEFLGNLFNLDWLNFVKSSVTGIDEVNSHELITFYPNPAKEYLQVNCKEQATLEIYNLQWQLLIKQQLSTHSKIIPVNDLSSGSYVVRIITNTKIHSEILIVK